LEETHHSLSSLPLLTLSAKPEKMKQRHLLLSHAFL
jgi:hypothetical protein